MDLIVSPPERLTAGLVRLVHTDELDVSLSKRPGLTMSHVPNIAHKVQTHAACSFSPYSALFVGTRLMTTRGSFLFTKQNASVCLA